MSSDVEVDQLAGDEPSWVYIQEPPSCIPNPRPLVVRGKSKIDGAPKSKNRHPTITREKRAHARLLLADGLDYVEIGERLDCSEATVRKAFRNDYQDNIQDDSKFLDTKPIPVKKRKRAEDREDGDQGPQAGVVEEPDRQPGRANSPGPHNDPKDSPFQKGANIVGLSVPEQLNSRETATANGRNTQSSSYQDHFVPPTTTSETHPRVKKKRRKEPKQMSSESGDPTRPAPLFSGKENTSHAATPTTSGPSLVRHHNGRSSKGSASQLQPLENRPSVPSSNVRVGPSPEQGYPKVLEFLQNLPIDLSDWYPQFTRCGLGTPKELFGAAEKQNSKKLEKAFAKLFPKMPEAHRYFLVSELGKLTAPKKR